MANGTALLYPVLRRIPPFSAATSRFVRRLGVVVTTAPLKVSILGVVDQVRSPKKGGPCNGAVRQRGSVDVVLGLFMGCAGRKGI